MLKIAHLYFVLLLFFIYLLLSIFGDGLYKFLSKKEGGEKVFSMFCGFILFIIFVIVENW